jgi:hypothetical protein
MIPIVIFPSILEDDLSNFVYVQKYTGTGTFSSLTAPLGVEAIKREDGQETFILVHGNINATSASLELENTNVDYQTTGAAKVILIIQGSGTTVTDFEIIEDATADAGTGTTLEDFPSVNLNASTYITSKVLDVAASKYITVKVTTGIITSVSGILVE